MSCFPNEGPGELSGSDPYRVAENGPNFPSNGIKFTYSITEQQGNRFAGTSTDGKFSETPVVRTDRAN
jgi:hypothetical protein